jgi:acetyl esterase/lipase
MRTTLSLLLLCAAAPVAMAQPGSKSPLPEGTRALKDLAYVPGGHERQKLDLYLPPTGSRWPLVVAIHGGAFRMGSKEGEPAGAFVARGFAVAAINYRLSQHAVFPAQIEDCKAAVRWPRARSRKAPGKAGGSWSVRQHLLMRTAHARRL